MAKQTLEILPPTEVPDLGSLAKQIDAAHVAVQDAFKAGIQRAAEAGHILAQAKGQVPHGQWEAWIEENTAVSPRTARGYMQCARFWQEATKAKRRALADLGLQGLLAKIAEPKTTTFHVVERVTEEEPKRGVVRFHVEDAEPEPKTIMVPSYNAPEPDNHPAVAALRLIGDLDPDTLARASKLDAKINLEDLSALLSDAAILALV